MDEDDANQNGAVRSRRSTGFWCKPQSIKVNVVILGASQVGKTAIASQFLWSQYSPEKYKPTVENFNWIEYTMDDGNTTLMFELIDSAGSRDFLAMRTLYMKSGDAFVIVHAVDNRASFEEAKEIWKEITQLNEKDAPVVLVTNKMDLLYDGVISRRAVDEREVMEFAEAHNCLWVEVTAKEFSSVEKIFQILFVQKLLSQEEYKTLKKRRQSMPVSQDSTVLLPSKSARSASASDMSRKRRNSSCTLS